MNKTHTRKAGKILERERIWQEKKREKRHRVLMEKSEMLLNLYLKYINPEIKSTPDQQLEAFYRVQEKSITDLQIVLRIDEYEKRLEGEPGADPVQFCKSLNHLPILGS